jgi:hypothetical protein
MVALFGCNVQGERASSFNNNCALFEPCNSDPQSNCPEGETCSASLAGLSFEGAQVFDDNAWFPWIPSTAVGGAQTISVIIGDVYATDLLFDAKGTDSIEIASASRPDVTIQGTADGKGYLRIVESGTNTLFDRIELDVSPVADVRILPVQGTFLAGDDENVEWALLGGNQAHLGVMLLDGLNERLVDEGIKIAVSGNGSEAAAPTWDTRKVSVEPSGSVNIQGATSAGFSVDKTFPIVEKVSEIVRVQNSYDSDHSAPFTTNQRIICFRAMEGQFAVHGAAWSFVVEGTLVNDFPNNDADDSLGSCLIVHATASGTGTITAQAGGFKKTFSIETVAQLKGDAPSSKPQWFMPRGPVLGERAR